MFFEFFKHNCNFNLIISKIKIGENKIVFGKRRRGFWQYRDIQSFKITQEQFRDTTIPVLELDSFDGECLSLGLTPDVSIDQLSAVLSGRIVDARKEAKNLFARKGGARQRIFAVLLMCFGVIGLIVFSANFFHAKSAERQDQKFETRLAERVAELKSEQIGKQQLEPLEKVTEWSLSTELLAKSNKMLIGMLISISVFLLGCVLMLWGNNRLLRNRLTRLGVYLADMIDGGTNQKSEG